MTTETSTSVKIKDRSWLEQPFAFTEADIKKHCPRLFAAKEDKPRESRPRVVKHVWAKSTYSPDKFIERCGSCGCRKRGPNHNDGTHHNQKVKAKR